MAEITTRAYTLKLSGNDSWRESLWSTHIAVNRCAHVWGDWLLTLRGGLPHSLAKGDPQRMVLLALSWLSVESPAKLTSHIIATGREKPDERASKVMSQFREILKRLKVPKASEWETACEPALTARIRDDAVWVDRSACFTELKDKYKGLTAEWAKDTLFAFLGSEGDYFKMPDDKSSGNSDDGKDFVQKAGGWLSRNWGSGEKSDSAAICTRLTDLAKLREDKVIGRSGRDSLAALLKAVGLAEDEDADADKVLKQLKQAIGWKGRSSKGAIALEKLRDAKKVSEELWTQTTQKLLEEASTQGAKGAKGTARPGWMKAWRADFEKRLQMPYRTDRDLIWEHGVCLDHALRRVSAGHTWIKRAEKDRQEFKEDAAKLNDTKAIPADAVDWLDKFRADRGESSGAQDEYLIRGRAIDGWEKIVQAWGGLGLSATRKERIEAAREVQANLDDDEKLGDMQLFAGFGDEDDPKPRACLADDGASCVWQDSTGKLRPDILMNYVAATVAEYDQRRFKVPAYRHPDPLRNPIYVDYGNSRWGIEYRALAATHKRRKLAEKLAKAKTDSVREKLRKEIAELPDLRGVMLDAWTGNGLEELPLSWKGKRLWNDLGLDHFGAVDSTATVSRADRLGRVVGKRPGKTSVDVAAVFQQKDWNGRLQVPRAQLSRLADLVYGKANGKRLDPDYALLDRAIGDVRARKLWDRLNWFLTTSAKLQPQGPVWELADQLKELDGDVQFRKGRTGHYFDYVANEGRKSRARILLSRIPGLRILSLDLGHRYAAACAVWFTVTRKQLLAACREAGQAEPAKDDPYVWLRRTTGKKQKRGRNEGQPITRTDVYRRIGPDTLPGGTAHPAPWAKLERQFLIKLQGEDRPARKATADEVAAVNQFRAFLGMRPMAEEIHRMDDLQSEVVNVARLGLRRLGDVARVAYAMTATSKPVAGGREVELKGEDRVACVQDALLAWHDLAASRHFDNAWAREQWEAKIVPLKAPPPVAVDDEASRSDQKKQRNAARDKLRTAAEQLTDPESDLAKELHRLWADGWTAQEAEWKKQLRWLRRFVLPHSKEFKENRKSIRGVGGLKLKRLNTIRDVYQVLKAFRMRPTPGNLIANIPKAGDESLADFGRRILDQLERLRQQRVKQLASRIVEAALGAGRMKAKQGHDRKRPDSAIDEPCHAVVIENLERYRPEETRLAKVNRRLMDWAARNVRKYIMEGCQLHGLHFVEVSPSYTSKQDSRTGAPGVRCEEVQTEILKKAVQRLRAIESGASSGAESPADTRKERSIRRWTRELKRAHDKDVAKRNPREVMLNAIVQHIMAVPNKRLMIRLPRRGGELFVSADPTSPAAKGLQADLNAAANIGLKALMDPDWWGAWWCVLANPETGKPVADKLEGCPEWKSLPQLLTPTAKEVEGKKPGGKKGKGNKGGVYAWNMRYWRSSSEANWQASGGYWDDVAQAVAGWLQRVQLEPDNPF